MATLSFDTELSFLRKRQGNAGTDKKQGLGMNGINAL